MSLSRFLENPVRDAAYALRSFRHSPGFFSIAALSVALGIAGTTTVFSMMNGLLLGQLPVREPSRLFSLSDGLAFSYPDFTDYRDQTRDVFFEGVAATFPLAPASIAGKGEPERVWGQLVSGNYFEVVGVVLELGRGFLPSEDAVPGRDAVVVLSDGLWRRQFASDRSIAGRQIFLNGRHYTVVGVAPPGFCGTVRGLAPEFWVPLAMHEQMVPLFAKFKPAAQRGNQWLILNARLRPGVTRERAAAALNVVKKRIDEAYNRDAGERRVRITLDKAGGLFEGQSSAARGLVSGMSVLLAVSCLVLLIACANVANLLLARATARQREMGIRLAIGAGRQRLVRQLLTESILLALFGAAGGFVLAFLAARSISRLELPIPIPIVFDFSPDLRVLAFTTLVAVLTGIVFGLAPALRSTRTDLVAAIKGDTGGFGRLRRLGLKNALVVAQVAVSLVLLTGSGLFLHSLYNASTVDTGLRPDNVLLMTVDPKLHNYSREQNAQFFRQLRERVSTLPGVAAVSFADGIPLTIQGSSADFKSDSRTGSKETNADVYSISERFFETMGIPLLRGRDFDAAASVDSVILNQTLAERLFPGEDPIGRRVTGGYGKGSYTVIGVAGNAKSRTLGETPAACAYLRLDPGGEKDMSFLGISIAARTTVNPRLLTRAVRNEIAALDPRIAVYNIETLRDHVNKALLGPRLCATLLAILGVVGLTLASVGLYGVMSYSARQRTREVGIRMALGAHRRSVQALMLRQGLTLAGAGLVIGMALALALCRFTASMLYGIKATDPATFLVVPTVLMTAAFLAALIPARRAAAVEPMSALRSE
jgi:predicted permease